MSRKRGAPGVVTCFVVIAAMDIAPRLFGIRRIFNALSAAARPDETPADATLVERTAHRVALAAAFYPRRALCLEQSLALCYLLQRCGVAARPRLGVQARPFHAHAWVSVDGRAINERGDLTLRLATFQALGG